MQINFIHSFIYTDTNNEETKQNKNEKEEIVLTTIN
jgi:hypothetical protein